ncbi:MULTISPECIES: hypothetical protein [Capnocytophaga]|uniref:hypothetical protein n=1 Tax=Capnocytophaga TaxID=1016 RepID=UPI000F719186|nr:hypothetical protein [Capnocytophaga canimorsus]VEJ19356.1 Uncharacterised protein [Capnocytophaga canimorsus]
MKNRFYHFIMFGFPLLVTIFFVSVIKKTDSNLEPIREVVVTEKLQTNKITIDKHASKRRVYFFVEKQNQKIKFERKYNGLVTNWAKVAEYKKYENNEIQYFYIEKNTPFNAKESIPFFGLNQSEKNIAYYFDIFLFFREKYFFALLSLFIGFIFGGGYLVDNSGGISANKSLSIMFFLNIVYLLFLMIG